MQGAAFSLKTGAAAGHTSACSCVTFLVLLEAVLKSQIALLKVTKGFHSITKLFGRRNIFVSGDVFCGPTGHFRGVTVPVLCRVEEAFTDSDT